MVVGEYVVAARALYGCRRKLDSVQKQLELHQHCVIGKTVAGFSLEDVVDSQTDAILPNIPIESQCRPPQIVPITNRTVRIESLVLCDSLKLAAEAECSLNIESAGTDFNEGGSVWTKPRIAVLAPKAQGIEVGARLQICAGVTA